MGSSKASLMFSVNYQHLDFSNTIFFGFAFIKRIALIALHTLFPVIKIKALMFVSFCSYIVDSGLKFERICFPLVILSDTFKWYSQLHFELWFTHC